MNNEYDIAKVSERLKTQDNRITVDPMFCVQEEIKDVGYDHAYAEGTDWINMESGEYEKTKPGAKWAKEIGYKMRWETVMVAFTEGGCKEYIRLNGHNHRGKVRIYAESFRRCPEMIAIRESLMKNENFMKEYDLALNQVERSNLYKENERLKQERNGLGVKLRKENGELQQIMRELINRWIEKAGDDSQESAGSTYEQCAGELDEIIRKRVIEEGGNNG